MRREREREREREGEREGGERERGRERGREGERLMTFFIIFLFFSYAVFIRIFIMGAWRFAVLLVSLRQ